MTTYLPGDQVRLESTVSEGRYLLLHPAVKDRNGHPRPNDVAVQIGDRRDIKAVYVDVEEFATAAAEVVAAVRGRSATDSEVTLADRDALNGFAASLRAGGWALLILACGCPAVVVRVDEGEAAYAEVRPVDLSREDNPHEHDVQGWLSSRALDYPVLVKHVPAATSSEVTR